MMAWGREWVLTLTAVAACTRPNLAFEDGGEATGTSQGDPPITSTEAVEPTRGEVTSVDPDTRGTTTEPVATSSDPTTTSPDPTTTSSDPTSSDPTTSEPGTETTTVESDTGVAPECGNAIHEPPGEQCDDGNLDPKDGCNPECQLESPEECGDGGLDPGEQCDDFNEGAGDGCGPTCQLENPEECGDGGLDPGEECDPGNPKQLGDGCTPFCQMGEPGA